MAAVGIKGGDLLEKRLRDLAAKVSTPGVLRVGFLEDATPYPDGTSVATIAAIQNFGSPAKGIPSRPFFSKLVRTHGPEWGRRIGKLLEQNDWDAEKALTFLGWRIERELADAITEMNDPPLSPVTLLLRQRFGNHPEAITFSDVKKAWRDIRAGVVPKVTTTQAKPLVWTGTMLAAISSEVSTRG